MKAITAVCPRGASLPPISPGRIHRRYRNSENDEIQMYLSKLRDLIPYLPKEKKLSKVQIIHHVIEYICRLQDTLANDYGIMAIDSSEEDEEETLSVCNPCWDKREPLGISQTPNTILGTECSRHQTTNSNSAERRSAKSSP